MPRRPAALVNMKWRDELVTRMTQEQQVRGMSDAGLAARVSKYYPMSPATIWKLKNAVPPRSVSLDEAMAIASAFEFDSLEDFLSQSQVTRPATYALGQVSETFDELGLRVKPDYDLQEAIELCRDLFAERPFTGEEIGIVVSYLVQVVQDSIDTYRDMTARRADHATRLVKEFSDELLRQRAEMDEGQTR